MKKILVASTFIVLCTFFFSRCYLSKYIYTDAELKEHYEYKSLKPVYKESLSSGQKMHYAVFSKNDTLPLLILIHGAPGAWYGYMNLTDDSLLQQHFKIVAMDRLGYGKSGYGKEVLSTQSQALSIKTIIDKENTSKRKVFIIGRSYGAPIAALLAIEYPSTFEKLIMISPVIDPDKEKFYWFSNIGKSPLVQWVLPELLNVATKEKFSHEREMRLMLSDWEKLQTPTCVLVGEEDKLADTANFSFAKTHLVNCPAIFIKLKHTGHQVTHQQPGLIKQLLLDTSNGRAVCLMDTAIIREVCERKAGSAIRNDLRAETQAHTLGSGEKSELKYRSRK